MKKIALFLVAAAAGLAGCVAVPYDNGPPHRSHGPYYGDRDRDGVPNRADRDRDRDGDGVRNRSDRRPNNPRRY